MLCRFLRDGDLPGTSNDPTIIRLGVQSFPGLKSLKIDGVFAVYHFESRGEISSHACIVNTRHIIGEGISQPLKILFEHQVVFLGDGNVLSLVIGSCRVCLGNRNDLFPGFGVHTGSDRGGGIVTLPE